MDPDTPIVTTLVSTSGTGNGGTIETPPGHPDITVTFIGPALGLTVRFANIYVTTIVGLLGAGMTTDVIPAADFRELLVKCATLAVSAAALDFLKNLVTIFGRLEQKYPLLRA